MQTGLLLFTLCTLFFAIRWHDEPSADRDKPKDDKNS